MEVGDSMVLAFPVQRDFVCIANLFPQRPFHSLLINSTVQLSITKAHTYV